MHIIPLPMQKGAEACNPIQSLESSLSLFDLFLRCFCPDFPSIFLSFSERCIAAESNKLAKLVFSFSAL
ncbi:hypothetical protein JT26_00125 [Porphyromonas sp. COT-108 OH1349]|nr:hypothetical protein JT26_00125 [Porphyromonas sp. COT-108 OH1349]